VSEARDEPRWFDLTAADVRLFNPNTRTIPLFRSRRDAEINAKMYRAAGGVLVDEGKGEKGNPWRIKYCRLFDMTNDSDHFRTRDHLEKKGWTLRGNRLVRGKEAMVPLFEAKMMHLWNPRFATYHDAIAEDIRKGLCRDATPQELRSPNWEPLPRYWVTEDTAKEYWDRVGWERPWVVIFRDIARSTDERTAIATFAPAVAFGNQAPGLLSTLDTRRVALLVANISSLPFDYTARNKVGGTHMNFFILDQLPVFPPEAYEVWEIDGRKLSGFLATATLTLTATSEGLESLAAEIGAKAALQSWDEEERFLLMRQIDAVYAHLYSLTREEFSHILDTFPNVRENDIARYGRFRTKEDALKAFDSLETRLKRIGGDSRGRGK